MGKIVFTEEEQQALLDRANEFMIKRPEASRTRVAKYAGCATTILERWEGEGLLQLPEVMTKKQMRNRYNWTNNG